MNVTKTGEKCSQLLLDSHYKEDSLQKKSVEHEGYVGVHILGRITENNTANASKSEERLLKEILDRGNLNKAYKRVKSKKRAHGD